MPSQDQLWRRGAFTHYLSMLALLVLLAGCTTGDLTETSEPQVVSLEDAPVSGDFPTLGKGKGRKNRNEPTAVTAVVISPGNASLQPGATQRFAATAKLSDGSTTAARVTWTATGGTIDASGLYTNGRSGNHRVMATIVYLNLADTASVTVSTDAPPTDPPPTDPPPTLKSISVRPGSATLSAGAMQRFAVSGTLSDGSATTPGVTWTVTGGTITRDGLYTAGQTAGVFRAVATDTSGTLADTAAVTITSTSSASGCSAGAITRRIDVSSTAQLSAAISNAQPGDCIHMADGIYQGSSTSFLRMTVSGTRDRPIHLTGSRSAILDGGGVSVGGFHVQVNASYWVLDGFTVRNRMQGVQLSGSRGSVVRNLEIYNTGQEALSLWKFSKGNLVEGNRIHDTGKRVAEYGEGIYLGMSPFKWATLNGGRPDQTDSNTVRGNVIGPNVTSELLDAKEGTAWNRIEGNTFDARGQVWDPATHWVDSWVEINGDDYYVADNRGSGGIRIGLQTYRGPNGWGNRTRYERNTIDLSTATQGDRYGIYLSHSPSGVVVKCDNTAAGGALSNVSCR